MKRSIRLAVLVGVASAVPAAPLVLAQVQKVAPPVPQGTTTIKVEMKKVGVVRDQIKQVEVKQAVICSHSIGSPRNQRSANSSGPCAVVGPVSAFLTVWAIGRPQWMAANAAAVANSARSSGCGPSWTASATKSANCR